jgi:hypothetical protein
LRHIQVIDVIDHFNLSSWSILFSGQFLQWGFQHILQIGRVGIEIEIDLGVGIVFWVFGRDLSNDVVGQLSLTSSCSSDNQTWVLDLNETVNEFLGGNSFSSWNGELLHLMILLSVEIDNLDFLGPLFEFDLFSGLIDIIVEHRSFLGEFDRGFPFSFPP